jgi:CRP-like cAMP-binding protein
MNDVGNYLLDALQPDELALLCPHLTRVRLVQKTVLQEHRSPIQHVFFPLDGMVSLVARFESGDAIEIAAIGRQGAIGTKIGRHPQVAFSRAIVQLPGTALRMDSRQFQDAALKSLAIMHIATCANDVIVANLQQSVGCNAYHPVESRLARWLLQAADHFEGDTLPLTQQFLSQMLGTRRTTVQLAAATLGKLGAIDYRRGKVHIKDRAMLEQHSCECYRAVTQNVQLICELARVPS